MSLDLARFDLGRAAVVVVPGDAFAYGGAEASDARVFRSLLNLRGALAGVPADSRPAVVAEVIDADKDATARQAYGGELEIVIINTAESEDTVFEFLAAVAPDLNPLMDKDGLVTEHWQPRGLPATFLVDPAGRLQYLALGGRPWDAPEYMRFLKRLIE